ncbi:origin of replication complex subunit 3 isoform X2 [Rosa chinensis]|uniref:origin of replication complex subunit 3 isoform X2 n=1 Tax=Rosa chinensis TaxID=74649 RepID=UPI000D08ECF8|nr:origin of replication complex subunit 3 isoform X2 [Rosa chinensis]
MAPPSSASSGEDSSTPDTTQSQLQHSFLLHKASDKLISSGKARRRRRSIDLSPTKTDDDDKKQSDDERWLRMEAFQLVWSRIESTINHVLRNINARVFDHIRRWVWDSFNAIKPLATISPGPFPLVSQVTCTQLFTGLLLTNNMEFVDDISTFQELGLCLKSHGCHVANLSSFDFSSKNGIAGCLTSLLRQFLMSTFDAADMSILASWYSRQGNYGSPVVVIIDDMERCCGAVLSDFILMLSEWVVKIPVILIMGVATTLDAPRKILSSNVLQKLCPCNFKLGSPAERMDAVVEAALVRQCSGFAVGHKVAVFLRNYFLNQDGTLTSFVRALKIACVQHFSTEPLSFLLGWLLVKEDSKGVQSEKAVKLASELLSLARNQIAEQTEVTIVHSLTELTKLQKLWSTVVLCLYEAGKCNKTRLIDLFCEALDPDTYNLLASDGLTGTGKGFVQSLSSDHCMLEQNLSYRKGRLICQLLGRVRDLPAALLCRLLNGWKNLTVDVPEIHDKVKELQSIVKLDEGSCKPDLKEISRHTSRSPLKIGQSQSINEKAAILMDCMVRDFMKPIECTAFHEIVCYRNVENLQSALIGDSRKMIQVDLLEFHKTLQCSCCRRSGNIPLPSMPDTSIMYTLAQEHGDLINLHDWFQSFKTIVIQYSRKGTSKLKKSPLKKRKERNESENKSEASIQARFCRAITELQITGLIRMPSKKRRDCVQRVAFGL